jgi:hypothetical protein
VLSFAEISRLIFSGGRDQCSVSGVFSSVDPQRIVFICKILGIIFLPESYEIVKIYFWFPLNIYTYMYIHVYNIFCRNNVTEDDSIRLYGWHSG